jgi:hypothetical protein
MAPPQNPKNVPTGGSMTYAALSLATDKQQRALSMLKRTCGNPPTWDDTCRLVLGRDWDGRYDTLSVAAASWLIHNLQRGLVEVSHSPDDLVVP